MCTLYDCLCHNEYNVLQKMSNKDQMDLNPVKVFYLHKALNKTLLCAGELEKANFLLK